MHLSQLLDLLHTLLSVLSLNALNSCGSLLLDLQQAKTLVLSLFLLELVFLLVLFLALLFVSCGFFFELDSSKVVVEIFVDEAERSWHQAKDLVEEGETVVCRLQLNSSIAL